MVELEESFGEVVKFLEGVVLDLVRSSRAVTGSPWDCVSHT